jgi:hypothetical protein
MQRTSGGARPAIAPEPEVADAPVPPKRLEVPIPPPVALKPVVFKLVVGDAAALGAVIVVEPVLVELNAAEPAVAELEDDPEVCETAPFACPNAGVANAASVSDNGNSSGLIISFIIGFSWLDPPPHGQ